MTTVEYNYALMDVIPDCGPRGRFGVRALCAAFHSHLPQAHRVFLS